jgi:3'-phosphoadenosine 5'-phosphosulfate sulfotransferase (PAPS reductase)/FAD synthetase
MPAGGHMTQGGLYDKFKRVSCWCCPLKSLSELNIIYREYPKYWNLIKEWEKSTYRTFRPGQSILDLENRFNDYGQGNLFEVA